MNEGVSSFARSSAVGPGRRVTLDVEMRPAGETQAAECERTSVRYTHGIREIPETLERLLEGLREGERKRVKLVPGQGYSPLDCPISLALERDRLPIDALHVGCRLKGETPSGRKLSFLVREVRDRNVVVQSNDLPPGAVVLDVLVRAVESIPERASWISEARPQ